MKRKFRKVSKKPIQYCDEVCELGWFPGCCSCKRKSEFAFTILLKSYMSSIISYCYSNSFFPFFCSIPLFTLFYFPLLSWAFISSFYSPISTDFWLSIFNFFLRTLFVFNTQESILLKLIIPYYQIPLSLYALYFILDSFQLYYPITVNVHHLLRVLHSLLCHPYS